MNIPKVPIISPKSVRSQSQPIQSSFPHSSTSDVIYIGGPSQIACPTNSPSLSRGPLPTIQFLPPHPDPKLVSRPVMPLYAPPVRVRRSVAAPPVPAPPIHYSPSDVIYETPPPQAWPIPPPLLSNMIYNPQVPCAPLPHQHLTMDPIVLNTPRSPFASSANLQTAIPDMRHQGTVPSALFRRPFDTFNCPPGRQLYGSPLARPPTLAEALRAPLPLPFPGRPTAAFRYDPAYSTHL